VSNSTPDTTPPTVPGGLTATAISSSQINLGWAASTDNVGVTGYNVLRGGAKIGTSVTTSYQDSGLPASTSFTYTVSAFDAAGNTSAQSAGATATTQASSGGGGTLPSGLGWFQIPNTAYQSVCPSYSDIQGQSGCSAVASAWGSGWADTKRNRMVLFGGGHTDYFGNEVYVLDLNANPISITLGKDASHGSGIANLNSCPDVYSDGNPGSRHDNDGMVYLPTQDLYFIHGGNLANCGSFTNSYWTLNPGTMAWTRMPVPGTAPNPNLNGSSSTLDYDPVSGKVYMVETNGNTFWQWAPATNVWTVLNGNIGGCDTHGYEHTSIIDPVRRLYFCLGVGDASKISLNAPYTLTNLSMKNCGTIATDEGPGLAYDSSQGLIVMWSGGNTVYLYNPDTDSCTSQTYSGGPGAQQGSGTYKRFQYYPALGVFILINSSSQNAFALRLTPQSGGSGAGPNISGVSAASITTSGATISWTTDVGATSQVEYGTTTSYGTSTTLNSSLVTAHSTGLTGDRKSVV
jgi:hypothetical protein